MYIKSIVLDGFKSYGQRTEVSNFDPMFNAITGLNGSGKSNILDAICFVLGISNLSHVRAGNLQDLIFKSGQAGINKASVSITFDNRSPVNCPAGYENFNEIVITRQVIMGGKSKYLLNGTTVANKKIQDLFCSIQLNVNNPHFLIMQGKVTKVLNMKSSEILSMVEEAAGTRMYEEKKQTLQKTIDKKDAKLREMHSVLEDEMLPKLKKSREEREKFFEFKNIERQLENFMGLFQAYQFVMSKKACEQSKQKLEDLETAIRLIEEKIQGNKERMKEIDVEIAMAIQENDKEGSEKIKQIEVELKKQQKVEAKINSTITSIKDNIQCEEKKKKTLEMNYANDEKLLKSKENEFCKMEINFQKLRENDAKDNEAYLAAEERLKALIGGADINDDGQVESLQEQLMKAQQEKTDVDMELDLASKQLKHCENQLIEKAKDANRKSNDFENEHRILKSMEKEFSTIEAKLNTMNYSKDKLNNLRNQKQVLRQEMHEIRDHIQRFEAQKPRAKFVYDDPESNFDRRKVFGVVCRLMKVKDDFANVALETAAGGRLFNVVIDNEATGKKLLQRGNFQMRTTFIPLDKIMGSRMDNNCIRIAQELVGKENVNPALSYLDYDPRLKTVMEYIFGHVFICKDISIAKQVAFHDRIRKKCVTLDGDIADPVGTLTGGAPAKGGSFLLQLREIMKIEEQLNSKETEYRTIENNIQKELGFEEAYLALEENLHRKEREIAEQKGKIEDSPHYQQQKIVDTLQNEINELKTNITNYKEKQTKLTKKVTELENKIKTYNRAKEMIDAQTKLEQLKKKATKSRKEWDQHEQTFDILKMEINELKKSLENTKQEITATEQTIIELNKQIENICKDSEDLRNEIKNLQEAINEEKSLIQSKNKEISQKNAKKEQLQTAITDYELEIKKNNHELKKLYDENKNIISRKQDFEKRTIDNSFMVKAQKLNKEQGLELEKNIRKLQESKTNLSRTINLKAQDIARQQEDMFNDLNKKQRIVENDRSKLIKIVLDLDVKKKTILTQAHEQISRDFGSIFSTLLPGADATLVAPHNKTILDGLEIKVSLGGVWKESLTELSGGQRSLAALSLILAMLLFKPAPLYILDEVDAALDLSHTQNIGDMLKTHFKKSQFIIVSLKDGMFNNANVLFRTKFVDGVSTITRTDNRRK